MYADRRLKFADREIPAVAAWQPAGWMHGLIPKPRLEADARLQVRIS